MSMTSSGNSIYYYCGTSSNLGIIQKEGVCGALKFESIIDAYAEIKKILKDNEHAKIYDTYAYDGHWNYYRVVDIDTIPYHNSWNDAFPIDKDHIPDYNRPVRIVPRDGNSKKKQVSGHFLHDLMARGEFFLSNDGYSRWEYDDDESTIKLWNIWRQFNEQNPKSNQDSE